MFKDINIFYNNVRSIKNKKESFKEIVEYKKPHIICLVETHLDKDEVINFEGYVTYIKNKSKGKGG